MKVRFAVAPGAQPSDRGLLAALVDGLESRGFDTIWLSDLPMADVLDPLLGLSFAASRTTRLKLGANVVPVGRNPMLLAKELAQLDRISDGRVLLSLVPGLDQPGERPALGRERDRGAYIDEVIPLLRAWWDGEIVEHESERFSFPGIALPVMPVQRPLEIWLGGMGPKALERVGRFADGWLGAALGPDDAGAARRRIEAVAAEFGRTIDPDHFGLSIPYAHTEQDAAMVEALLRRNPDADPADVVPVGIDGIRDLIRRLVENGLTKFVLRPTGEVADWEVELEWLGDAVLDLQS